MMLFTGSVDLKTSHIVSFFVKRKQFLSDIAESANVSEVRSTLLMHSSVKQKKRNKEKPTTRDDGAE